MTTEEDLLAAIKSHPNEDTPRLMYADWLDEQEHPQTDRAELIRVGCRTARLLIDDGDAIGFVSSTRREDRLTRSHPEWFPKCPGCLVNPGWIDHPEGTDMCRHCNGTGHIGTFTRGFIEQVSVPKLSDVWGERVIDGAAPIMPVYGPTQYAVTELLDKCPLLNRVVCENKSPSNRHFTGQGWMFANGSNEELELDTTYDPYFVPGSVFTRLRLSNKQYLKNMASWVSFPTKETALDELAIAVADVLWEHRKLT